jgi:hypothetical protein
MFQPEPSRSSSLTPPHRGRLFHVSGALIVEEKICMVAKEEVGNQPVCDLFEINNLHTAQRLKMAWFYNPDDKEGYFRPFWAKDFPLLGSIFASVR